MGGGERTPLLRRTTNHPSISPSSSRRRPRATSFLDSSGNNNNHHEAASATNHSVELLWHPSSSNNNNNNSNDSKVDRRGLTDRIGNSLSTQLRQARSALQAMRGYRRAARGSGSNHHDTSGSSNSNNQKPHDISSVLVGRPSLLEGGPSAALPYRGRISTLSRSHHDWTNDHDEEDDTNLLREQDPGANTTSSAAICCSFGTSPHHGIWLVVQDPLGCAVAFMVWILLGYSMFTVLLLTRHRHWPRASAAVYCTVTTLALMAHAKTVLTDPGSVPPTAVPPTTRQQQAPPQRSSTSHLFCAACCTYKPPRTHHCRICGRCIARMDHHCPWMNNCIGASNFKHFLLFLVYSWLSCVWALLHLGYNYFGCGDVDCEFSGLEIHLARVMTVVGCIALLFISTILTNVTHYLLTGVGTIDRLQQRQRQQEKLNQTSLDGTSVTSGGGVLTLSDTEPMRWSDVFGNASVLGSWWLPVDPVFDAAQIERLYGFVVPPQHHQAGVQWQEASRNSSVGTKENANDDDDVPQRRNSNYLWDYSSAAGAASSLEI